MYEPQTPMGKLFTCAGYGLGLGIGLIKGSYDALKGGSFEDGAFKACNQTVDLVAEFGDKHGEKIVSRVLTGLLIGVGMDLSGIIHHDHGDDG